MSNYIKSTVEYYTYNTLHCEILKLDYLKQDMSTYTAKLNDFADTIGASPSNSLIFSYLFDFTIEMLKIMKNKSLPHKIVSYDLTTQEIQNSIKYDNDADEDVFEGHYLVSSVFSFIDNANIRDYKEKMSSRFGDIEFFFSEEAIML